MLQREAIKSYLEKAVPKGLSLKKQMNICDELTCHIQDKADFYMEIGYDEEKSYEKALEEMGDGEEVCQQFEDVYQEKTIHAVLIGLGIFIINAIALLFFYELSFEINLFYSAAICLILIGIAYFCKERHPKALKAIGISHIILAFMPEPFNPIYQGISSAITSAINDYTDIITTTILDSIMGVVSALSIGVVCLILSRKVKRKESLSEKGFKTAAICFAVGLIIFNIFNGFISESSLNTDISTVKEMDEQTDVYNSITSDMTFEEADNILREAGFEPIPDIMPKEKPEYDFQPFYYLSEDVLNSGEGVAYMANEGDIGSNTLIAIPCTEEGTITWKAIEYDPIHESFLHDSSFDRSDLNYVRKAKTVIRNLLIGSNKENCVSKISMFILPYTIETRYADNETIETVVFTKINITAENKGYMHHDLVAKLIFTNGKLTDGGYHYYGYYPELGEEDEVIEDYSIK